MQTRPSRELGDQPGLSVDRGRCFLGVRSEAVVLGCRRRFGDAGVFVQADSDVSTGQLPRLNRDGPSVASSWARVQCGQLLCVIAGRRDGIKSWLSQPLQDGPPVDHDQRQRRFQFSLRKLMLWMAVLAVYLGVLRWMGWVTPLTAGFSLSLGVIAVFAVNSFRTTLIAVIS